MLLLEKFLQDIDIPVFYVTHSSEEVARLADNLVLLANGVVSDHGAIQQVLGAVDGELSRSDTAFSMIEGQIATTQLPRANLCGLRRRHCATATRLHLNVRVSLSAR